MIKRLSGGEWEIWLIGGLELDMLVKFKNKMIVGLAQSLEKARHIGGIPDYIEVDQYEARDLINEFFALTVSGNNVGIKLNQVDQAATHIDFLVKNRSTKDIVIGWHKGEYEVSYNDVPIKIKVKKVETPDVPEPQGPLEDEDLKPGLTD